MLLFPIHHLFNNSAVVVEKLKNINKFLDRVVTKAGPGPVENEYR